MIELHHLRHFLAVLEAGSINRAARDLHISQPALTKSIQRMEELLGSPLFDRTPKPVPTRFGETLAEHARAILAGVGDLEQEVADFQGLASGTLTVGAGPVMADAIMGPALGALLKRYPKMRVQLHIDNYSRFPAMLRARDIDLFIADVSEVQEADDLTILRMPAQPILWFCRPGHPVLARPDPRFADVLAYPIAAPSPPRPMKERLDRAGNMAAPFELAVTCSHYSTLKVILEASDCICGAIEPVIRQDVQAGRLAVVPIKDFTLMSNPGLVTLRHRVLSPAAEALVEEIRRLLAETLEPPAPGTGRKRRAGKSR